MFDRDLRSRVSRLLNGDFRPGDLDRLFLGQRERGRSLPCLREIGDFVAHRDTREKGLVTQTGRDVFTSVEIWSRGFRNLKVSLTDLMRAASANLRLATDQQLKTGCGSSRGTAKKRLDRAQAKIKAGQRLTEAEAQTFEYLGNRFIWRPAFTSDQLFNEFRTALAHNGYLEKTEFSALENAKAFLGLFALSVMHGSSVRLESGEKANLYAGFANRQGLLEVKIQFIFNEMGKPLIAPTCLFLTDLGPEEYCESELLRDKNPVLPNHWDFPIEVSTHEKLSRMQD